MTTAQQQEELLLLSPPGQFDAVASELTSLGMDASVVTAARTKHAEKTGSQLLQDTATTASADGTSTPFLGELETAMASYKAKYYSTEPVEMSYSVNNTTSDSTKTGLDMFAQRLDTTNFTSASWHGQWSLDESNGTIAGTLTIHVHCFESGNVQMQTKKTFNPTKVQDAGSAKSYVNQISRWEAGLLTELTDMYEQTMTDKLKTLRRVMPITRTRMEWNVLSHRMVQNLSSTGGK